MLTPHTLCIWLNSPSLAPLRFVFFCGCGDQTILCCSWAHLFDLHRLRNCNSHQTSHLYCIFLEKSILTFSLMISKVKYYVFNVCSSSYHLRSPSLKYYNYVTLIDFLIFSILSGSTFGIYFLYKMYKSQCTQFIFNLLFRVTSSMIFYLLYSSSPFTVTLRWNRSQCDSSFFIVLYVCTICNKQNVIQNTINWNITDQQLIKLRGKQCLTANVPRPVPWTFSETLPTFLTCVNKCTYSLLLVMVYISILYHIFKIKIFSFSFFFIF